MAAIGTFGNAKAVTVDATQSVLINGNVVQVCLGCDVTIALTTTAANPFDGAAGGDYTLKLFNGSNLFNASPQTATAGSTTDAFTYFPTQQPTSIVIEALSGVSFDLVSVFFSSTDPNKLILGANLQAVGAPFTPNATPLPAALPLFATGLGALGLFGWRRKRKPLAAAER